MPSAWTGAWQWMRTRAAELGAFLVTLVGIVTAVKTLWPKGRGQGRDGTPTDPPPSA